MRLRTVNGEWTKAAETETIVDPLNGEPFLQMPATQSSELQPFVDSMAKCPKHGLHNPFKNVQRYAAPPEPLLVYLGLLIVAIVFSFSL